MSAEPASRLQYAKTGSRMRNCRSHATPRRRPGIPPRLGLGRRLSLSSTPSRQCPLWIRHDTAPASPSGPSRRLARIDRRPPFVQARQCNRRFAGYATLLHIAYNGNAFPLWAETIGACAFAGTASGRRSDRRVSTTATGCCRSWKNRQAVHQPGRPPLAWNRQFPETSAKPPALLMSNLTHLRCSDRYPFMDQILENQENIKDLQGNSRVIGACVVATLNVPTTRKNPSQTQHIIVSNARLQFVDWPEFL